MPRNRQQRRDFLRQTAAALGASTIAGAWPSLLTRNAYADSTQIGLSPGYGPLRPTVDQTTGLPLLRLPEGFSYVSYGWTGEAMDDGLPTPGFHDGMGMIRADDEGIVLCRNHEIKGDTFATGPVDAMYDRRASGGCTNLLFDPMEGKFKRSWKSLAGTSANCAGGTTPWGTWLSCEETVWGPGDKDEDASAPFLFERDHGWVFEVPPTGLANPTPIRDMGRFWHEAVAIDERTGVVYQTEDRRTAGFYRYLPNLRDNLRAGGRLEMMRLKGHADVRQGVWNGEVDFAHELLHHFRRGMGADRRSVSRPLAGHQGHTRRLPSRQAAAGHNVRAIGGLLVSGRDHLHRVDDRRRRQVRPSVGLRTGRGAGSIGLRIACLGSSGHAR